MVDFTIALVLNAIAAGPRKISRVLEICKPNGARLDARAARRRGKRN